MNDWVIARYGRATQILTSLISLFYMFIASESLTPPPPVGPPLAALTSRRPTPLLLDIPTSPGAPASSFLSPIRPVCAEYSSVVLLVGTLVPGIPGITGVGPVIAIGVTTSLYTIYVGLPVSMATGKRPA